MTKKELYESNNKLFVLVCNFITQKQILNFHAIAEHNLVWKSRYCHDGHAYHDNDKWFIAGIGTGKGTQIFMLLPNNMWDKLEVHELPKAPEWDGHTAYEAIERLERFWWTI